MIDTGVRHAVVWLHNMNEVMAMNLDALGALIRHHSFFSPEGTNVSVAAIDQQGGIHLRTYERGVEEKHWPVEQERWRRHGWRWCAGCVRFQWR